MRFTILFGGLYQTAIMQFTINVECDTGAPRNLNKADHRHRGLRPLLFVKSAMGSLTSPTRRTTDKCRRQGQRLNVTAQ